MKLKVTVNIGNYENVGIESSEYNDVGMCITEVQTALRSFKDPRVDAFCNRIFKEYISS